MASLPISELPVASALTGSELVPVVQSSSTDQSTIAAIATYVTSVIPGGVNIYTTDGTLTENRTVTMNANSLTFNSTSGNFSVNSDSGNIDLSSTSGNINLEAINGTYLTEAPFVGGGIQTIGVDNTGKIIIISGDTTVNIYNSDGTLTGNRTLTMGGDSLTFIGSADFNVLGDSSSTYVALNLGVENYGGVYNSYFGAPLKNYMNMVSSGLFTGSIFNGVSMTCYNNDDIAPAILFNMARGTSSSPTILQNGQVAGEIDFSAYTGDTVGGLPDFRLGSAIYTLMEADASSGKAPMALYFDTSDATGAVLDRMYIGSVGNVVVSNDPNQIVHNIPTTSGAYSSQFTTLNTSQKVNSLIYDVSTSDTDALIFARAQGTTFTSQSAVTDGDVIGSTSWWGFDGTNFIPTMAMGCIVSGVSSGVINSTFEIMPENSNTAFNMTSAGKITLGVNTSSELVITGTAQILGSAFVGHGNQPLGVDNSGNVVISSGSATTNIYNSDGTLTGNRTMTMGTYNLYFGGSGSFNIVNTNFCVGDTPTIMLLGGTSCSIFGNNVVANGGNNSLIVGSQIVSGNSNNFLFNDGAAVDNSFCVVASAGICLGGNTPLNGVDIQTSLGTNNFTILNSGHQTDDAPNTNTFCSTASGFVLPLTFVLNGDTNIEGRIYELKDVEGNWGTRNMTVSTDDGSTIDGLPQVTSSTNYGYFRFKSYNGNWIILGMM